MAGHRVPSTSAGCAARPQPCASLLVTVTYDDGDTETYQVPLVHHTSRVEHLMHAFVGEGTDDER